MRERIDERRRHERRVVHDFSKCAPAGSGEQPRTQRPDSLPVLDEEKFSSIARVDSTLAASRNAAIRHRSDDRYACALGLPAFGHLENSSRASANLWWEVLVQVTDVKRFAGRSCRVYHSI